MQGEAQGKEWNKGINKQKTTELSSSRKLDCKRKRKRERRKRAEKDERNLREEKGKTEGKGISRLDARRTEQETKTR